MYNDENDAVALARKLTIYDYVLIDTCSLMEDSFPTWMDRLAAAKVYLSDSPTQIYVPKECIIELERHSKNKEDFNKRATAKRALIILKKAKKQKLVSILKKQTKEPKSKAFADRAIYVKVSADRSNQKILVITQDKKLASDLIALNNLLSQKGRYARVVKFDVNSGELVPNRGEFLHENSNSKGDSAPLGKEHSDKAANASSPKPISAGLGGKKHGNIRPAASHLNKRQAKAEASKEQTAANSQKEPTPLKETAAQPVNDKRVEAKAEEKKAPEKKPQEKKTGNGPVEKKAENAPAEKKKDAKLPFRFGMGPDVETALSNCAFSAGLMFRYPSIPYLSQFHGPVDLTENDLKDILAALSGPMNETKHFSAKGLFWRAEQMTARAIRVTVERKEDAPAPILESPATENAATGKNEAPAKKLPAKEDATPEPREHAPAKSEEEKESKPESKKSDASGAQSPVLTEEEYAAGKAKILAEKDYISSRNVNAIFRVGPYRGNKILKRLQSEAVLSDVADPTRGFRVLKDVEDEAEAKTVPSPVTKEYASPTENAAESKTPSTPKNKAKGDAPRQNKPAAKSKKASEAKNNASAHPSSPATKEKAPNKTEKVTASSKKDVAPAKPSDAEKNPAPAAKKAPAKKGSAPKKGTPSETKKAPSKQAAAPAKGHAEPKKAAPAKSSRPGKSAPEEHSEQGRLIVLAPASEEERRSSSRKPAKAKEKNASITVKDGKKGASPKAKAPTAPSEAFVAAKKKEAELQKVLSDASLPKEAVIKAIDEQLALVESLTPVEKRKLHYHKTQLLLLKKEAM